MAAAVAAQLELQMGPSPGSSSLPALEPRTLYRRGKSPHLCSLPPSDLFSLFQVLHLFCSVFILKVGTEKRPTWENILRRPQHEDYHLGKTTATPPWVSV